MYCGTVPVFLKKQIDQDQKSTIAMLPVIDPNPGDESCIFSVLLHIKNLEESMGIPTQIITFDHFGMKLLK